MALQVLFFAAVPGSASSITVCSIGVSCLSFVFAFFAKRNLRDGITKTEDEKPGENCLSFVFATDKKLGNAKTDDTNTDTDTDTDGFKKPDDIDEESKSDEHQGENAVVAVAAKEPTGAVFFCGDGRASEQQTAVICADGWSFSVW